MMEAAFTGFALLDPPEVDNWRATLGIGIGANLAEAREAYRRRASEHHPDRGGSSAMMAKINAAWLQAQAQLS
jgi:DnaJ-domain-containing protein 1